MIQNSLVPKRRLMGFTDEWSARKFDEEIELYSGLTYSPNDVNKKGTFVLRSSNVKFGEIVAADDVYVNSEVVNSANVKTGDIIVVVRNGSRSLIGKHALIKNKMDNTVIGAFMTGIRSGQPHFINALLDTARFKKEIEKNLGATINQITNGMFREMTFLFPEVEEQQKIGNFFKHLDQMISLEQRKLEKTKALKSAYLTEMFPAEGERVPKRRFAGFTGEWKLMKFEEKIDLFSGLTYSPKDVKETGTFVLRSSNVKNGEIVDADNVYVNSEVVNSSNVRIGDIIVVVRNGSRSLIGKHAQIKSEMCETVIGAFMTGIRSQQPEFINALLDTKEFKKEIDKNLGATINQITNGMFRNMIFLFPDIQEQKVIGEFFGKLDNSITNQQQKLNKLKAMKQAYLKEMFV